MKASDMLRNNNGLKTTQSVLNKQQSGVDAAQKASPEQMNMNTAQAMLQGKQEQLTPPKNAHEQAARMNQQTAEGMLNGSIPTDKPSVPIVKKEEQKPQPKQLSYADMYKMLNPEREETAEQKANREKKERTKARIAALGDGLRALSNIYFSTRGAKVVHNPESDMTKVVNKRKEYMDAQREKNQAAWLTGYQRALALDEEARKNNLTLAEQIRYHDMMNENNKTKNDQGQQRIDQGNRRLDLSKMKYQTDADYKKAVLAIKKALADGQISHWQAQEAILRMNAETGRILANKSGSGGSSKEDTDETLIDLNKKHPKEVAEANETVAKAGIKPNSPAGRKQVVKIVRKKVTGKGKGSSSKGGGKHNNLNNLMSKWK